MAGRLNTLFETDRLDVRATERDPSREGQRKLGTYRIGQAPLQLRAAKTRRGSDSSSPSNQQAKNLSTKIGMRRPSLFLNERLEEREMREKAFQPSTNIT